jgi:CSLREA domain-containing protein
MISRRAMLLALLPVIATRASAGLGDGPTFVVNSTADIPATAPLDDGVCETSVGNHQCTLRAAIMEANHVPGGGATVRVPAGTYVLTIPPGVKRSATSPCRTARTRAMPSAAASRTTAR